MHHNSYCSTVSQVMVWLYHNCNCNTVS